MEGSEGDNQIQIHESNKINNSGDGGCGGGGRSKRVMKTPFQLEALEKAYALETYPSESIRAELSEKLGLSDRQLQMWFCHRRLKDKKDGGSGSGPPSGPGPAKKQKKAVMVLPEPPVDDLAHGSEPGSDYGSGSGSGSSPFGHGDRNVAIRSVGGGEDMLRRRHYGSQQQVAIELRAIAIVEAQLGGPVREDGPVLGIEFDPLPPDAFGAPLALAVEQQKQNESRPNKGTPRSLHEYPYLQDHSSIRPDLYGPVAPHFRDSALDGPNARTSPFAGGNKQLSRVHGGHGQARLLSQDRQIVAFSSPGDDGVPQRDAFINVRTQYSEPPIVAHEGSIVLADGQINDTMLRMERKRKGEDVRMVKGESHEVRIRKDTEKQDILRRKNEERIRRDMERQERERRKEDERLMRERQREEERSKKEQKREIERREKFLQKENIRAEKRRQREELRKERDEVKRKAALEKATARRLLNKSMELYEDEQLELMELAAASKGLSSITSIDPDTNLDAFRDELAAFPSKSVLLKKPFAVHPWIDSEENIGNFLMVWRFLITFADILELWPFTLDEFVQAFHDYDSRLLGEIHVALLRLIIKDIEDVARTPSTGLGLNQNGAVTPGGGHPQIVEGAYAWGFDIRNWQQHLNLLTWPEIFRQLALSAGFGPQLKKRSISWSYLPDNDEGKGCHDVISTLRNGSAAVNAFAVMQEKGLLAPRRSRHRLTPGTVKFAAFHVLSLEGNKGLTVLELADKIQKSGLRDLTTSKTPEASISVALTRDTKLFERIAPSTYRVRSAYRKDPIDAESILSEARKKIQIFENGILAPEDVDEVERDDVEEVEREEDSECDDADEDPKVDELATPDIEKKFPDQFIEVTPFSENGQENLCNNVAPNVQTELDKNVPPIPVSASKEADGPSDSSKQCVAGVEVNTGNLDQDNMEIDESKAGESWVQGLTEGDYSDLSVEERLNSLVSLIGIANEGNSIRVVLEDRLEAANALKKQMLAEAQLDKSRLREESLSRLDIPSFMVGKAEAHVTGVEYGQSPLLDIDNRITEEGVENQTNHGSQLNLNHLEGLPIERALVPYDISVGPENILNQQLAYASRKSHSHLKSYIAHKAEEFYAYRSLPLGQDRRHNRYWQFVASASSNDPGSGRIFIELSNGDWRLIDSEEAFDTLLTSLDTRGVRESHLRLMLHRIEASFKESVRKNVHFSSRNHVKNDDEIEPSSDHPSSFDSPVSTVSPLNSEMGETSSSFRIELNRNENEKRAALRRYQDFQKWMWRECFSTSALCASKHEEKRCRQLFDLCNFCLCCYYFEDSHCSFCHQTFGATYENLVFSEHVIQCQERKGLEMYDFHAPGTAAPLASRLLKAFIALVEVFVPPEALQSFWTEDFRKMWGAKLNVSSSVEGLLQMLTLFETAIKRDFVSSNFAATEELLGSVKPSVVPNHEYLDSKSISVLPWIPHTTAAVALRVYEMDSAIAYVPHEKHDHDGDKESGENIKFPLRFTSMMNDGEIGLADKDQSAHLKSSRNNLKRGRGSREQGRGKRSKSGGSRRKARVNETLSQGFGPVAQKLQGQGSGRGRRTVRKRRTKNSAVEGSLMGHMTDLRSSPESGDELPRTLSRKWNNENISTIHTKDDEGPEGYELAEPLESEDEDQAVGYEQGNWGTRFDGTSGGWNDPLQEASDEDMYASEDDNNGIEEVKEEDSEGDVGMSDASDEVPNTNVNDGFESVSDDDDYSD